MRPSATLKAGDWVQVRTAEQIRATLDEQSQLDAMPFMPEMLRFCGQRFQVASRAHKTCDTVDYVGGRHLMDSVHLEGLRCDGAGHGGCDALCLLFWKEAWLEQVDGPDAANGSTSASGLVQLGRGPGVPVKTVTGRGCTEAQVTRGTRAVGEAGEGSDPVYVCQATQLLNATTALKRSDVAQYVEDYASGNAKFWRAFVAFLFLGYSFLVGGRYGLGAPLRWLYDTFQKIIGGTPYPFRPGKIPKGGKTPSRKLDLQAGELVRVRTFPEILETVDEVFRNRGMGFHSEMVPFTGKTYRVLRRLEHIVHEKTGRMIHLKNDCIILDGVTCQSRYINNCRRFCPRAVYLYFREIWLERVDQPTDASRAPNA